MSNDHQTTFTTALRELWKIRWVFWFLVIVGPIFLGLQIYGAYLIIWKNAQNYYTVFGYFGETFGFLNCVISAFAVLLVYVTYTRQREEFELQRQHQLEESAKIDQERSAISNDRESQMIERHSFMLISNFQESLKQLRVLGEPGPLLTLLRGINAKLRPLVEQGVSTKDQNQAERTVANYLNDCCRVAFADGDAVECFTQFDLAHCYIWVNNQRSHGEQYIFLRMLYSSLTPIELRVLAAFMIWINWSKRENGSAIKAATDIFERHERATTFDREIERKSLLDYFNIKRIDPV